MVRRQFVTLLQEDQRARWQRGERVKVEAYVDQYAALQSDDNAILDLIYNEVLLREQQREAPRLEEYLQRFPRLRQQLRDQFELHVALASKHLFPSAPTLNDARQPATAPLLSQSEADWPAVPGYEILGVLGRGAMGVVYSAWQTALNRCVALKIMLAGVHAGRQERARFQVEAEAVARLQHPNIVQIYEVGQEHGRPYLALEFVNGGSLARQFAASHLAVRRAAELVETLARAIHYAHSKGVVHRDLKPDNILLQKDEGGTIQDEIKPQHPTPSSFTPKITDFGLAKLLIGGGATQTQSGTILGTPSYMAPEQAEGQHGRVSPAVDVYALGAILYEALTGQPPFKADTVQETIRRVVHDEPAALTRLRPQVPRDLETICLKCLRKEPRRRYASALDLAEDLRRFLSSEPIGARPIGVAERGLKWVKRKPALATLLGVSSVGVLGLIGLLGALWRNAEARAAAVQELASAQTLLQERQEQLEFLDRGVKERQQLVDGKQLEIRRLGQITDQERAKAAAAQATTRQALYIRDVELAQTAFEKEQIPRLLQLLEGHRPRPDQADVRGFEWYYLWRLCHQEQCILRGHKNYVRVVTSSPDGKTLATVDFDGVLKLWDVATQKALPSPQDKLERIHAVAFSLDDKLLATGSEDGTVKVSDRASGQVKAAFRAHADAILGLAFAPDGKTLATGSKDGTAKSWDVDSGQLRFTFLGHRDAVRTLVLAPDGKTLATVSEDRTAKLWDMTTGREKHTFIGRAQTWVSAVAFAPDRKTLATAEVYPFDLHLMGYVKIRDAATGQERASFEVPLGGGFSLAYSPDGKTLAVGGNHGTVTLRDVATRRIRQTFHGHSNRVFSLAFVSDGKLLATGASDTTVRLWDVVARPTPATLQGSARRLLSIALAADGRTLATGGEDLAVRLWDVATGEQRSTLIGPKDSINSVSFAPNSATLAAGSSDATVRLWDLATHRETAVLRGHQSKVSSVAFAPDGTALASASFDGSVKLWDPTTGQELATLKGHTHPQVWSVAFSADGQTVASAGQDSTVRLWDRTTGQLRDTLPGHGSGLLTVAFAPDGRLVAAAEWDGKLNLWNVATKERFTLDGHTAAVLAVLFDPDGKTLLSGSRDSTVKLWDVATRQERFTLRGHTDTVTSLALAHDGRQLATASHDGTVKLWDAAVDEGPRRAFPAKVSALAQELAWHRREADEAGETRQWLAAIWHFDRLIQLEPGRAEYLSRRAQAYAELGRWDQVMADYSKSIELKTADKDAWFHRGRAHAHASMMTKALEDYDRILALTPQDAAVWLARFQVHARSGQWAKAAEDYANAVAYSQVIQLKAEIGWVQRYRATSRGDGLDQVGLPLHPLQYNQRHWQAIAFDFSKLLDAGTTDAWVWRGRGLAYAALGQWDKAAADFGAAGNRQQTDADAWLGAARARAELGQWEQAATACAQALGRRGNDASAWYLQGVIDAELHHYDKAVSAYTKAVELGAEGWAVRGSRSMVYAELRQWGKAAADLAKATRLPGASETVWSHHALLRLQLGDTAGYRQACASMLARFGTAEDPATARMLAWTCSLAPGALTDPRPHLQKLERAAARNPNNCFFLHTLGAVLYRAGQFEAATHRLNEAMQVCRSKGNPEDWLYLAMTHSHLNQPDEARRWLDKATHWIDQNASDVSPPSTVRTQVSWHLQLVHALLRREAEGLVMGPGKSP
jgi:WD40 repeat protein/tetratricopeptide (TPR) repeat protein